MTRCIEAKAPGISSYTDYMEMTLGAQEIKEKRADTKMLGNQ